MYISPIGRNAGLYQTFGKTRLSDNTYEMNIKEDRASVQGLFDISEELDINSEHMPLMQQFLALSSKAGLSTKLPCGYTISAEATPDLTKPERISKKPEDIKAIVEFDPKDSTHILAMRWAPGVTINYSNK